MNNIKNFINYHKKEINKNLLECMNSETKYYYVFEKNDSGKVKAFLITDNYNNLKNKVTLSRTSHCFLGDKLFRIHINNKTYCINPDNSIIIKIDQTIFDIGDIIYKNNEGNFEKISNNSFLHLYNYEVQYFQKNEKNMNITAKGYKVSQKYILNTKYKMHEILNNNVLENNSFIKTTSNLNKNLNLKKKSNNYRKNIIRKKVFFSKEIMKIKNLNNVSNISLKKPNMNESGSTTNENYNSNSNSSSINYPKIIENLNEDKETIKILYNLYLKYKSREKMTRQKKNENIYNHLYEKFNNLLNNNNDIFIKYFLNKKKNYEIIKKNKISFTNSIDCLESTNNMKQSLNSNFDLPIIYNIKTDKNVILIGDIHGSFHSFFRIFLRLLKQNIIDNDLKLNNYKLIFLGDVFDRGQFGYECLILILLLMKKNNTENELNVMLNRGNHENFEVSGHYGFMYELFSKVRTNKRGDDYAKLYKFIETYLSSAIILNHNNTKYWLCHGGFPFVKLNKNGKSYLEPINFSKYKDYDIIMLKNYNLHIEWNDFHNNPKTIINAKRGSKDNSMLVIGTNDLKKFLDMNNIKFIIRGHQDNDCNDHLLINYINTNIENHGILPLTFLVSYEIIKKYNKLTTCKYKVDINNNNNNVLKKSDGSFMTINPNSNQFFQKNNQNNNQNNNLTLYPVLTISTNSDLDRNLFHDSFVVLKSTRNNQNL